MVQVEDDAQCELSAHWATLRALRDNRQKRPTLRAMRSDQAVPHTRSDTRLHRIAPALSARCPQCAQGFL